MNDLDTPAPETEIRPTTGLLRVQVKADPSVFDRAMKTMAAFDATFRSITETMRLWPEALELMLLPWNFPNWADYRRRPYDWRIDD